MTKIKKQYEEVEERVFRMYKTGKKRAIKRKLKTIDIVNKLWGK